MKEWIVIHKIKSLYDEGHGLSARAIAKELGISRSTVKRHINMNEESVSQAMEEAATRQKCLDDHKDSIVRTLQVFPRISAVKVLRKLKSKDPELDISERSMRRYIGALKASGEVTKRIRHYEPVVDMLPGMQCQVDGGELRNFIIDGVEKILYFLVFVLSCSRLMYVSVSLRPINSEINIRMHDAAFRAFGGVPEECVYDQTKLVLIHEQYRELDLNERFAQYAATVGFRIHCCHAYDPESKGKVESGVKYVKENCLYGETFDALTSVEQHVANWLETVANVRTHGTTGRQPLEHYEQDERQHMKAYLAPVMTETKAEFSSRNVDKTGLISWHGNRYSVPMKHQRGTVYILEDKGELVIHDISGNSIGRWLISAEKGKVFKNRNHYRDPTEQTSELEEKITNTLGEEIGRELCQRIQFANPRVYKDQLRGLHKELTRLGSIETEIMTRLLAREAVSVLQMVSIVEAYRANPERLHTDNKEKKTDSTLLQAYAQVASNVVH